ncbi:hypothetical protein F2Q69_00022568 [Brassica cretica]|uniref:Uncharacterized protein n=1 Tax=Brassica cretica TaxID=69181 RepID=A0A8S9QLG4_BRACR|nr:hypothetical protein F2Q69_00022568 [Brassica cretica]
MTRAHQFHSRQGNIPHLEDLLLQHAYDRLIPEITINQMEIYTHCSTSTTLLTGSGHDLQLISRVPPCSLKHLDTSSLLQHIEDLPSVPAMCPLKQTTPTNYRATCSHPYASTRLRSH